MSKHYKSFSVNDFAQDEYFIQWVKTKDEDSDRFWRLWIEQNPHRKQTIEEARALVEFLVFEVQEPSEQEFEEVKQKIDLDIENSRPGRPNMVTPWLWAATLALLTVATWLIYSYGSSERMIIHSTMYGETKMIVLPDNSVATLNANSTLSYVSNWDQGKKREVWLDGEAFFDIKKIPHLLPGDSVSYKCFLVYSGAVNVEVLGTSFNVNNRNDSPKIVLNSGKIALQIPVKDDTTKMHLIPGDYVEYVPHDRALITKRVDPKKFTSWTDHKLHFEETSLLEVAEIIEDNFGKKVVFESEELQEIKLSGTVSTQNLDVFVTVLSESIDRPIVAQEDRIIIKN